MTKIIVNTGANWLQRLNRIRREFVSWLNGIGAVIALYALANPVVSDKLLGFIPEDYREIAAIALPVAWFWLVQKGKEVDRQRTIAQTNVQARLS